MKNYLCFITLLLINIPTGLTQEFLLHEETFTWTKDADICGGFHYWYDLGEAPSTNWKTPYDYQNGQYYFRFEVIDQPSSEPFKLNMCIWTERVGNVWKEECTGFSPTLGGPGSNVTYNSSINFQLNGINIDWTDLSKLWRIGNPIFVNGHNLGPNQWCSANPEEWAKVDLYFPMRLRMTIVAVASGHTFSGWANYPVEGCTPAQQTTPAYGIDFVNETTNKPVPSTDEYSYNANMSGAVSGTGQKLTLTPGQTTYFRSKKVSDCLLASNIQTLVVPARPSTPSFSVDYSNERTIENAGSTIEYSTTLSFTNPVTGSGSKVSLTPGQDLYLRLKATPGSFASSKYHLIVPIRPATPNVTIDYMNETTTEVINTNFEYSLSSSFTIPMSGSGNKVLLTPGQDMYFRVKATSSSFASLNDHLIVPTRPSTPSITIDFKNETTTEVISTSIEYSASPSFTNPIVGTGIKIPLIPGQDLYFRVKPTASQFTSAIQTLDIPIRPTEPQITIDFFGEVTSEITNSMEYSTNESMSSATSGNNTSVQLTPGTNLYVRIKYTATSFYSDLQILDVPVRPEHPAFAIDFQNEITSTIISSEFEYANNPGMADLIAGNDEAIPLTPGSVMYFRQKATGSKFASQIQELLVPQRPVATTYSIDFLKETTIENVHSHDEYANNIDMTGAMSGNDTTLSLVPGNNYHLRIKNTTSSFSSDVFPLQVPSRPVINSLIGDTIQENSFIATIDFYANAEDLDSTDFSVVNAKVIVLNRDSIQIVPLKTGNISFSIIANALPAGNFTSELFTTFYKDIISRTNETNNIHNSVIIYPNPFKNEINITVTEELILPLNFRMVNYSGNLILQTVMNSRFETISLFNYPEGLYILNIIDSSGKVAVFKVIKN